MIWRFAGTRPPPGRLAVHLTTALRRAVMSRVADPLPQALHGHGSPGQPHVAFLALPDVGAEHSDGHLLGLAVAVPSVTAAQQDQIQHGLTAAPGERTFPLRVPGLGTLPLRYQPGLIQPSALDPRRWQRGSRHWVTATPVVLDRHPHRGHIAAEIERSLYTAGLPTSATITSLHTSTQPLQPGALRLRPSDLPAKSQGRLYRHVAVTFDHPVEGPIVAGAARHLGIGLFTPHPNRPTDCPLPVA